MIRGVSPSRCLASKMPPAAVDLMIDKVLYSPFRDVTFCSELWQSYILTNLADPIASDLLTQ
jgi:hypothetical protein